MATGPIETHLHRSFNWENGAPDPRREPRGVQLTAGMAYLLNVFG